LVAITKAGISGGSLYIQLSAAGAGSQLVMTIFGLARSEVILTQRNLISNALTDLMHSESTGEFRLT